MYNFNYTFTTQDGSLDISDIFAPEGKEEFDENLLVIINAMLKDAVAPIFVQLKKDKKPYVIISVPQIDQIFALEYKKEDKYDEKADFTITHIIAKYNDSEIYLGTDINPASMEYIQQNLMVAVTSNAFKQFEKFYKKIENKESLSEFKKVLTENKIEIYEAEDSGMFLLLNESEHSYLMPLIKVENEELTAALCMGKSSVITLSVGSISNGLKKDLEALLVEKIKTIEELVTDNSEESDKTSKEEGESGKDDKTIQLFTKLDLND